MRQILYVTGTNSIRSKQMTWKFMAKYCLSSNMSICSINFHGKLFHLTAFFFVIEILLFFVVVIVIVIDCRFHNIFSSENIRFYLFWLKICVTIIQWTGIYSFQSKKNVKMKWYNVSLYTFCWFIFWIACQHKYE